MNWKTYTLIVVMMFMVIPSASFLYAQPKTDLRLEKPAEYSKRKLASEKSNTKRFPAPKRFIQNTVTHYNYFFNANNKLNEIIEQAKLSHKDDYSKLLPFYNYSLDATANNKTELDSVILKAQSGIALHDLRNDWIDNMYLLWGAAYHLQKKFDSSYLIFQYMSVAFAERQKNGSYKIIGSRRDGGGDFSIATKEKTGFLRKVFSRPPSRNEIFVWQIKNYLEQEKFGEAASMIITLKNDPLFPTRLYSELAEMQAYSFYKQQTWDSAALYLEQALPNAGSQNEKARWEYLIAQLSELSGDKTTAEKYYSKTIQHTTDLVLDIYARLYRVRVSEDGADDALKNNVAQLLKMAKRDKYEEFRDIIYYMAAQMQFERNDTDAALSLLQKSIEYPGTDPMHRNRAFLQLANLSYEKKHYPEALNYYSNIQLADSSIENPEEINTRKSILIAIVNNLSIIARQDSLQRIAAMPEEDRKDYVKKLVRKLRKQSGLKDESVVTAANLSNVDGGLFSNNTTSDEWYFYNGSSRTKGLSSFKAKWGNRSNTDSWRRSAAAQPNLPGTVPVATSSGSEPLGVEEYELTFDILYQKLPLTPELLTLSNDSIQNAKFALGRTYIQEMEQCADGSLELEELRTKFPQFKQMDELLFQLYYCYHKNGETAKAAAIKMQMEKDFTNSSFTTIVSTGKNPTDKSKDKDAAKAYEKVYDLFIEGNFEEAITQKNIADSLYNGSHWTPQLLYIESIYYIKNRQDSIAIQRLEEIGNNLIGNYELAMKAKTLISVLKNRTAIEDELTKLELVRPVEELRTTNIDAYVDAPSVITKTTVDSSSALKPTLPTAIPTSQAPVSPAAFVFEPTKTHYVALILNKVDRVYGNEVKNAFQRYNKSTYYNQQMNAEIVDIDGAHKLLLLSPFSSATEAVLYIQATKPRAAANIIPWLKAEKYSFTIISDRNLELLKTTKDIPGYQVFLDTKTPIKL